MALFKPISQKIILLYTLVKVLKFIDYLMFYKSGNDIPDLKTRLGFSCTFKGNFPFHLPEKTFAEKNEPTSQKLFG